MPDIREPVPDDGHEALRQSMVEALDGLSLTDADVGSAFELVDTVLMLLSDALAENAALRADLDALTARVDALNPPPP